MVTSRCKPVTGRRRVSGIVDHGTASALAAGSQPGGNPAEATPAVPPLVPVVLPFLAPFVLASIVLACGSETRRPSVPDRAPAVDRSAADPALGIRTYLDGEAPRFGEALLAELTGDEAGAAALYKTVVASDAPDELLARAALHLARIESRAGRNRDALDLVARASALAPNDVAIADAVTQLRTVVGATAGVGALRGPPLGTALSGVTPEIAAAFADAEEALARVHSLRPRPFIGALSSSIRAKQDATERAVKRYEAIATVGGVAAVAAHYRAGSAWHDFAISLLFALPPELEASMASGLRRTLRNRALHYLERATVQYGLALSVPADPAAEQWRSAAQSDLRAATSVRQAGGR